MHMCAGPRPPSPLCAWGCKAETPPPPYAAHVLCTQPQSKSGRMIYRCLANSDSGRYSDCVQADLVLLPSKVLTLVCKYFQQTSCFSQQCQDNFFTRDGYALTVRPSLLPTPSPPEWKNGTSHPFLTHTTLPSYIMDFHEGILSL